MTLRPSDLPRVLFILTPLFGAVFDLDLVDLLTMALFWAIVWFRMSGWRLDAKKVKK